jgi:hypothetical protein
MRTREIEQESESKRSKIETYPKETLVSGRIVL